MQTGALKKLDAHVWEREANEHYVEPEWCSVRLFQEEDFTGPIHDPCCGFGRIPGAALAAGKCGTGRDLVDRANGEWPVEDFMTSTQPRDNMVFNPPFNIAEQFALHALKLTAFKVAMVFPTARLNAAHWLRGKPLRRVWLMTPRPSMPPGHTIAAGEKPGGGKMDYCWLVFDKSYRGDRPELMWLRRDNR